MTQDIRSEDSESSKSYMKRGMETREHDSICDRRVGPLRLLVYLLISSVALGGGYSYSQNEGMKSINSTQDTVINENIKDILKVETSLETHINDQKTVNREILQGLNQLKIDIGIIKEKVE